MRRLAISDVHGCLRTLEALLDRVQYTAADHLFFLGDYVDRGPDSKGVIDLIWRLQRAGHLVDCLSGNHEQLVVTAYDTDAPPGQKRHADAAFLKSFGIKKPDEVPAEYIDWMRALPLIVELPDYILVHAGLHFGLPDPLADREAMTWMRDWYPAAERRRAWFGGRMVVHGHTPTRLGDLLAMRYRYDVLPVQNIDNGCFATHVAGMGGLCCFDLDTRGIVVQLNVE
jgi:serine/threonine protein phosphatase 1